MFTWRFWFKLNWSRLLIIIVQLLNHVNSKHITLCSNVTNNVHVLHNWLTCNFNVVFSFPSISILASRKLNSKARDGGNRKRLLWTENTKNYMLLRPQLCSSWSGTNRDKSSTQLHINVHDTGHRFLHSYLNYFLKYLPGNETL